MIQNFDNRKGKCIEIDSFNRKSPLPTLYPSQSITGHFANATIVNV